MEQQVDEVQWVAQTLAGDQLAFTYLVERYTRLVYNHAYRMLNDAQDAEDAVQEIFLKAYMRLDSFDPSRRFVSWLLTISSNHCIDRLRRKRQTWLTLDDVAFWLPSSRTGPERYALEQEQRATVQQALQQLPEHYRLVMILRYWHELSYTEIADITELTESTVKTRLHRGRKMLVNALGTDGELLWNMETITS